MQLNMTDFSFPLFFDFLNIALGNCEEDERVE